MLHSSAKGYNEAASSAAHQGRERIQEIIHKGLTSATAVIEKVQATVIQDSVVRAKALDFALGDDGFMLSFADHSRPLHPHALRQVLEKADVPTKFSDPLLGKGDWGRDLLRYNLKEIYKHSEDRHLVREEQEQVKGFLSDRFRRLDVRPLLDAFAGAINDVGLVPFEGYALDTKVRLRAILPAVFEPVKNEVLAFGADWTNSDFGDGGHGFNLFVFRTICTNLAVGQECLRQVHLGKRLDDNIAYSQKTLQLDTEANASALRDMVLDVFKPAKIHGYLSVIKDAAEEELKGKDVAALLKKHLGKNDAEKALELYESNDVVNLPAGNTAYRMSNAVSWLAQAKGLTEVKKLELQKVAGDLLPSMKIKAREA